MTFVGRGKWLRKNTKVILKDLMLGLCFFHLKEARLLLVCTRRTRTAARLFSMCVFNALHRPRRSDVATSVPLQHVKVVASKLESVKWIKDRYEKIPAKKSSRSPAVSLFVFLNETYWYSYYSLSFVSKTKIVSSYNCVTVILYIQHMLTSLHHFFFYATKHFKDLLLYIQT